MNLKFLALIPATLLCFMASGPLQAAGELRAGVGRVVITPESDMWMAGYAARKGPSEGKIHDLWAKALAIEDETGARTVIVTTDLLGLTAPISAATARIARARFDLPRERLLLTASHTHCGPVVRENLPVAYDLGETQTRLVADYTDALPALLAEAIGRALDDLEPSRLSWGMGRAEFAVNRRQYTLGGVVIGVNPIGPVDRSVPVLKIEREDGSLKGVLFGYACHNTTLSFQKFCGDYAGFAQEHIERELPGATALFVMGCGADANPNPRGTLELARRHGAELGEAVLEALGGEMTAVRGPVRARYAQIDLSLGPPPAREEIERRRREGNVYVQRLAGELLKELDRFGSLQRIRPYPIQVLRFSDTLQITALAGEVVVDYALRLRHELGAERHFIIGYANDVFAYIPSLRVLREGGYEAKDSMIYYGLYGPWAPEIEDLIIEAALRMTRGEP